MACVACIQSVVKSLATLKIPLLLTTDFVQKSQPRPISNMSLDHNLVLNIPFETAEQAEIARNTLIPDPILKSKELNVEFETASNTLVCTFSGVSDRVIRVAISNVIDNIKTIIECMDEFDGKKESIFT